MEFDRFCHSGMKELSDNVLPFWLQYVNSIDDNLFAGVLDAHGVADESADISSILLFRVLWSFSSSYCASGNREYLDAAIKIYTVINRYFQDDATGFFYDRLNANRIAVDDPFSTVTQAYAIYSIAEFYAIFSDSKNAEHAVNERDICEQLFTLIYSLEHSAKVQSHGVYNNTIDVSLKRKDLSLINGVDVRCQLHLVEALSNFYRVTGNSYVCELLTELLLVFELHVFSSNPKTMTLEFDVNWQSTRREISYGHNVECAWILFEASKIIDNKQLTQCLSLRMVELVNTTCDKAMNSSSAIIAGVTESGVQDERMVWWVQTEAINALLACFELTKDAEYLSKAQSLWVFIQTNFRDLSLGEWFSELTPLGDPNYKVEKVGPWRGPYHITRTCLKLYSYATKKKLLSSVDLKPKNIQEQPVSENRAG